MFVKLSSGAIINVGFIVVIELCDSDIITNNGVPVKYILRMSDGTQWYLTEKDYDEITHIIYF